MHAVYGLAAKILKLIHKRLAVKDISKESSTYESEDYSTFAPLIQQSHQQPQSKAVESTHYHIIRLGTLLVEFIYVLPELEFICDNLGKEQSDYHHKGDQHSDNWARLYDIDVFHLQAGWKTHV